MSSPGLKYLGPGQVSAAIVQASKQPSRGFGALLGNAASKRKFGIDKVS